MRATPLNKFLKSKRSLRAEGRSVHDIRRIGHAPAEGRFPVNIDLECETEDKVRVRLSNFSGISLTTKIHGCFTAKWRKRFKRSSRWVSFPEARSGPIKASREQS